MSFPLSTSSFRMSSNFTFHQFGWWIWSSLVFNLPSSFIRSIWSQNGWLLILPHLGRASKWNDSCECPYEKRIIHVNVWTEASRWPLSLCLSGRYFDGYFIRRAQSLIRRGLSQDHTVWLVTRGSTRMRSWKTWNDKVGCTSTIRFTPKLWVTKRQGYCMGTLQEQKR